MMNNNSDQDPVLQGLPEPPFEDEQPENCHLETGEEKIPGGRPRKQIDQLQVIKLARLHCSVPEIAEFFNVEATTIRRRFGTLIKQCQAETRARIRQEQLRAALNGNVTMLIFLGKVMLGQREDAPADEDRILPWTD